MESCNGLTLDHINAFFSLSDDFKPINVVGTATGGAGIDNLQQYPPPKTKIPEWINAGTEYVKKYTEKDNLQTSRQSLNTMGSAMSALSVCTLEDVDDASTIVDLPPGVNDLESEATKQIYSTYFNVPRTYDTNLSITSYREEILKQLNISSVLIIQGPTGCGKTTQVPQYILDYYQTKGQYCNIAVTQPRKLAAISIANRVCHERNWQLGTIVGYQVAMDRKTSTDTRLCYMTTGCFLEKLVNAKRMDMFTHVIIDEVHERNQDIDFALLLVKKFLRSNSQRVKVILMSATFESTDFAQYFAFSSETEPAPIIEVYGKSQDVTEHYLHELKTLLPPRLPEYPDMNYPAIDPCLYECVSKLMCVFDRIEKCEQKVPSEIEYAPQRGAVLIFLPGYDEIAAMSNKLLENNFKRNYWIVPLHSTITVEEQRKVFQDAPQDHRKVIISTNIAESSITVPDIKYVIDFCLTKNLVTDKNTNYTCLQLEWASKANCIQRKGRAGRVDIGKVYRMVPKDFYDQLPDYTEPEIKRCPLTSTILHVKKLDICEPLELLAFALDPPMKSDVGNAVTQLKEALALTCTGNDPFDGNLTFVGQVMANLPLDIKLSKLIVFGYVFDCLEDCIIIAASLSLQSFFSRPFDKALDAYKSKLSWDEGTGSDCITYLKAYRMWKELTAQRVFKRPGGMKEEQWAVANFIQLRRIREVEKLVKEIKSRLEQFKILADYSKKNRGDCHNDLVLQLAIAGAFFPQYFVQENLDEVTVSRELNGNDPHSTVILSGLPKHAILYASSLKEQLTCCAENMKINFEGKNAYVMFDRNYSDNDSTVQRAVYLACKMRKLRLNVRLELLSNEEAERKVQQIMANRSSSESGNNFASNRITVNCMDGPNLKKDMDTTFPLSCTVFSILITEVKNCGKFWARIVSSETSKHINFLEVTINSNNGANLLPLSSPPKTNHLLLAPYQEPNGRKDYYRAVVQEIRPENRAVVYFIDYGNVEIVNFSELRQINPATPDVKTIPPLAFECQLAGIKPSSSGDSTGNWCPPAIGWFKKTVSGYTLTAEVYSVVQGIPRLELRKTERDGITMSINKQLLYMGYAEVADESLASKQNHELRVKASEYSADSLACGYGAVEKDVEVSWNEAGSCTNIMRTGRSIRLHGPSNPCEVTFTGITAMDSAKQVKIDADSVNSVCINADPQDPYSRVLVAASVAIRQTSQDLVARNTTLLPKKRGMATLICLLFAPQAEIRTNKDKQRYTGALCGLGYDSKGEPLYGDHDIEIPFDIEISLQDISDINGVRMGFNFLLNPENNTCNERPLKVFLERIRKMLLKLTLHNCYVPQDLEWFGRSGFWRQTPQSEFIDVEAPDSVDSPHVLPLHRPPELAVFRGR